MSDKPNTTPRPTPSESSLDDSPCSAFVVQHLHPDNEWRDFTQHCDLLAAQTCVANKRDKAGFRIVKRTERIIEPNSALNQLNYDH
jgi:hypothetical protein